MGDNDQKETFTFKVVLKNGEETSTCKDLTGEATVQYSNGDRYVGNFVNGVCSLEKTRDWNIHLP